MLEAYAALATRGIALLREVADRVNLTLLPKAQAAELSALSQVYFGATTYRRLQRSAIARAEEQQHGLDELRFIEKYAARLDLKKLQWQLRDHLCGVPAERLALEARETLRKLKKATPPRPGVRICRGLGADPDTVIYTGESELVTRLYDRLYREDHAAALRELLDGSSALQSPEAAPHVVIPIDDLVAAEQGSEDVILTLTDGSRISGATYAEKRLHEVGFVTLLNPVDGPVNLYRTARMANMKQRLMASAENPICPWPQCRQPAQRCQIHHMDAWKNGGETNASNLTVACKYHNACNDDDDTARRGRLERRDGTVTWVPPGSIAAGR